MWFALAWPYSVLSSAESQVFRFGSIRGFCSVFAANVWQKSETIAETEQKTFVI